MAMVAVGVKIALIAVLVPWCINILSNFLGRFFYIILCEPLFSLIDFVQSIFRRLAGLEPIYMGNGSGTTVKEDDIVLSLITNARVIEIFITMALFAVALLIIATIVQLIRVEYTTEGSKNSKGTVIGAAIKSLAMFVLVPVVCIMGVMVSNTLLKAVDRATSQGGASSIAGAIFLSGAAQANVLRTGDRDWVQGEIFLMGGTGSEYKVTDEGKWKKDGTTYNLADYVKLADTANKAAMANAIDSSFASTEGQAIEVDDERLYYHNTTMVRYFYNFNDMNLIVMLLASGFALTCLFKACFGLVMRLYKVVALFIISPGVIALQPLDGGNAYKAWRKNFIGSVLGAYGTVIALNLFFFLIGIIKNIQLFGVMGDWNPFNTWAQCIFILVGLLMLNDMSKLISGYIGGEDVLESGTKMAKSVGDTAKKIGSKASGIAVGGANAVKGISHLIKSAGYNKKQKALQNTENEAIKNELDTTEMSEYNALTTDAEKQKYLNDKFSNFDDAKKANVRTARTNKLKDMNMSEGDMADMGVHRAKALQALNRSNVIFQDMVEDSGLVSLANGLTGGYVEDFGGKKMKDINDKIKGNIGGDAFNSIETTAAGPTKLWRKSGIATHGKNEKNWFATGLRGVARGGAHALQGLSILPTLISKGFSIGDNWMHETGSVEKLTKEGMKVVNAEGRRKNLQDIKSNVTDRLEDSEVMMSNNVNNFRRLMQESQEAAKKGELAKLNELVKQMEMLNNSMKGYMKHSDHTKRENFINSLKNASIDSSGVIKTNSGKETVEKAIGNGLSGNIQNAALSITGKKDLDNLKKAAIEASEYAINSLTEGAEEAMLNALKAIDKISYDPKIPTGKIDAALKKMYKDIEEAAAKAIEKAAKEAADFKLAKMIGKFSKK